MTLVETIRDAYPHHFRNDTPPGGCTARIDDRGADDYFWAFCEMPLVVHPDETMTLTLNFPPLNDEVRTVVGNYQGRVMSHPIPADRLDPSRHGQRSCGRPRPGRRDQGRDPPGPAILREAVGLARPTNRSRAGQVRPAPNPAPPASGSPGRPPGRSARRVIYHACGGQGLAVEMSARRRE